MFCINDNRDYNIELDTLYDLIKNKLCKKDTNIIERPQHYFMRCAVRKAISQNILPRQQIINCISYYDHQFVVWVYIILCDFYYILDS